MLDITFLVTVLGCILISMTLHEAMHAYASNWLGDDTARLQGRLTLNPLAHIDPIMTVLLPLTLAIAGLPPFGAAKPVPFNPYRLKYGEIGAAIVAAAGPLTNLVLAAVVGVVINLFGTQLSGVAVDFLATFLLVNASFFLLNIIPFPPLDGSRVLYAIAPEPVQKVMERIEAMGIMAIMFFFLLFSAFLVRPFTQLLLALIDVLSGGKVVF